jgi:pyruvate dehydrogenase E1 component alpha subunit
MVVARGRHQTDYFDRPIEAYEARHRLRPVTGLPAEHLYRQTERWKDLLEVYEEMRRLRLFEEEVGRAVAAGEIHGEMHLGIGYEAVSVALRRHLRPGDAVVSTHRAHLHALAAGVDPVELAAELLERDGLNRGKGGHMHLFDPAARFMCTGIVGAGVPIASGYALAQSFQRTGALTVAVMGDGTMNQGAVFETMNLAAVRALPMVFLCEDNGYSISVRRADSTAGELSGRGEPFGIPGLACDGTESDQVDGAIAQAFEITQDYAQADTGGRVGVRVPRPLRGRP